MAKEVDSIHLLSCAIEASLGNDFPAFAFRLPGEDGFYWGACEPDRLMTLADGVFPERQEGFFFAPFEEGELPRYFFPVKIQRAEEISLEALNYGAGQTLANLEIKPVDSSFEQYEKQVNTLVAAMSRKEIKKAVLSRTVTLNRPVVSDGQLFFRLAAKYDSAFVSWVNVPGIGRWIGATPETLLDCDGVSLTTMALAGTRKAGAKEPWGQKEQEEQQIVTDYISKVFRDKGLEPIIGERFSRKAGQVEHLCTPISLKVGSVFQNPRSQFFNVDTTSELAFGPENHGIAEDLVRDRVKRVAAQLKLEPLLDRSIFSLSGGEKQKIACGSAAAIDPDIYVLDEPSSNLDAYAIADFRQLLFTLKSQGKTIIISEHRLYYLSGLFDRVLYLKDGEIDGDYTAEEFCGLSAKQRDDMGLRPLDLAGLSEVEGTPQRMNEAVWTIKNVSFAYKHEPETLHITETSFPSGSATAIIGHNGAGKSTFARCLCGLEKHFKGTVQDQSKNYSRKERLKLCYMVMQDVNHQLFTESVLDEILLSMRTEDKQRAREILQEMDLLPYEDCHPMGLSGGQKQRVAVASAIASERPMILFDEPTSGLDFDSMTQVAGLIRRLSDMGKVIFIVTHDFEFVCRTCSRVLHFDEGEIPDDVLVTMDALPKLRELFSVSDGKER